MQREAGVLMHISSLPNNRGIGSFGKQAYKFVDFMAKAKLKLWQVLPLCPTSYGDSPYQSPSALAGNPYFIDIDTLISEGLLLEQEAVKYGFGYVDYGTVYFERYDTLRKAYARFKGNEPADYKAFIKENAFWLDDYAIFMALKTHYDMNAWETWKDEHKFRTGDLSEFEGEGKFWKFLQYEFYKQWGALKTYANKKGVKIVGDMPIYVAYDSVDVWSNPKMFLLRDDLSPEVVAGVPPDYFSADGQLWGNPIYDWKAMKPDYKWWVQRIRMALKLYDVLRIDHFRAFSDYYEIPFGATNARVGEWRDGAGIEFFNVIKRELNDPAIIAEDLGELHDCVKQLVKDTGYPGMKILQFAFDGDMGNPFLYQNYNENCVAYTGTHDNDTTRGWFEALTDSERARVERTIGASLTAENVASVFIDRLMNSKANTVIIPMQDFLGLDTTARMNIPSTLGDNWDWRSKDVWTKLAASIKQIVIDTGRDN